MESPKLKLLIADDTPENVDALKQFFETDYEILTAETGEDAIRVAKKEIPFCILMDIQMPQTNGLIATQMLKNMSETRHIPVIVLTAFHNKYDEHYSKLFGANAFMKKPVDLLELQKKVRFFEPKTN